VDEDVDGRDEPGHDDSASFRDGPKGLDPESIAIAGVMDSGLAGFARAPE
jgi:hypothetical protein